MDFAEFFGHPKKIAALITDVDGTICEPDQPITKELAHALTYLQSTGLTFAFISGRQWENLHGRISTHLSSPHYLLANTGAHCQYVDGKTTEQYQRSFTIKQTKEILSALESLIAEEHIQPHQERDALIKKYSSQITLCGVGCRAPRYIKAAFDTHKETRTRWVIFLQEKLNSSYTFNIGGDSSLDICLMDKGEGILTFCQFNNIEPSQVIFFGDKLYPSGNDYAATKVVDCLAVKNPIDTLKKIQQLFSYA